jgi:hypothetical protein
VIVTENGTNFILHVPGARKAEIAPLMAYRGLTFSTSASTRENAVLFSIGNPYSLADLAEPNSPTLGAYRQQIDLSRALDGKGTTRLPPGREFGITKRPRSIICSREKAASTGISRAWGKPQPPSLIAMSAKRNACWSFARRR